MTGIAISCRCGARRTRPPSASWSTCSQAGQEADVLGRFVREGAYRRLRGDPDRGPVGDGGRGDIEAAAVDLDVAVDDELARLAAGRGEAEPEDDVVEPALEHPQQCLPRGRLVVAPRPVDQAAHLLLADPVGDFQFLGLAQLQAVDAGRAAAAGAVLSGRCRAPALERGLATQLPLALEVERDSLPPLQLLHRSCVSAH